MTIAKFMADIQAELKVNKGQYNNFGKYAFRSCEDIIEAVKPILFDKGLFLNLSDEMVHVGDRYYIKATASICLGRDGGGELASGTEVFKSTAYAREPLTQKGMNEAQITGSASSYARKYALNGLLAIDDTKDADTQDNREQISPDPIDHTKVQAAYNAFKFIIDADVEVMDHKRVQEGWKRLTNDEQLAVSELFGKQKVDDGKGILYRSVIKNLLAIVGE